MWTTRDEKHSLAPMAYETEDDIVLPTESWWERTSPRLGVVKAIGALAVGLTVASFTAVTIMNRVDADDAGPRLVEPTRQQAAPEAKAPATVSPASPPPSDVALLMAPPAEAARAAEPDAITPLPTVVEMAPAPAALVVAQPETRGVAAATKPAPPPRARRTATPRPRPAVNPVDQPPPAMVSAQSVADEFPYDPGSAPPASVAPAPPSPVPGPASTTYEPDAI